MPAFASPEWIAAFDEAVSSSERLREATASLGLTVRQTLTDPDGGPDTSWHVVVDHGTVHAHAGPGSHADLTFSSDLETARSIAAGTISVQTAFMVGRLVIGGDTAKLMEYAPAFDGLADIFDGLRSATTY